MNWKEKLNEWRDKLSDLLQTLRREKLPEWRKKLPEWQRVKAVFTTSKAKGILARVGAIIGIWIVIVLIINFIIMPLYVRKGSEIAVPDYRELQVEQAQRSASQHDFDIIVMDDRYVANIPEGQILEQYPRPNEISKPGRRIHVIVSSGIPTSEVPNVRGIAREEAILRMQSAGLTVDSVEYRFSPDVYEGEVMSQTPQPGEVIDRGTGVNITVSLGAEPEEIIVPDVLDLPYPQARYLILKAGLSVGDVTYDRYVGRKTGAVMNQDPPPRTSEERDAPVHLVVNRDNDNNSFDSDVDSANTTDSNGVELDSVVAD